MESIKTYQEGECYVLEAPRDPTNVHEMKVFNPDYFKDLGFPNATISIVGGELNGNMVGGYYESPEELTWPFRQFVYMVQPTTKVDSNETPSWFPEIKGPGFYEEVVGPKPEESVFDKLMGKVKTYFSSNTEPVQVSEPTPPASEETKSILDMEPVQVSEPTIQTSEDMEQVKVSEEKEQASMSELPAQVSEENASVSEMGTKWLVRFCKEPADESAENQIIRQYRANKMRGITMTNTETYKIWNVEIKLGVVSQGESILEISGPEGSQGYKWSLIK